MTFWKNQADAYRNTTPLTGLMAPALLCLGSGIYSGGSHLSPTVTFRTTDATLACTISFADYPTEAPTLTIGSYEGAGWQNAALQYWSCATFAGRGTTRGALRLEECATARSVVEHFATLGEHWDGYGGLPISERARNHARHFIDVIEASPFSLSAPEVSPNANGTIAMEWEIGATEAYLEIGNTRYSGYIKKSGQRPVYLQGQADALDQRIVAAIESAVFPRPLSSNTISEIRIASPLDDERVAA